MIVSSFRAVSGDCKGHDGPGKFPSRQSHDVEQSRRQTYRGTRKKFSSAAIAAHDHTLASYTRRVDPRSKLNNAGCGNPPTPPTAQNLVPIPLRRGLSPVSPPTRQPRLLSLAFSCRLRPGIGPSPDLNPWDMAAVGYPLWLWADGPTHVGPISDAVAGSIGIAGSGSEQPDLPDG